MNRHVPYLAEDAIERDAAALLAEFAHARGIVLEPPIPVEDIVEKHLKLRIEFDNLHARYNIPRPENGQTDILGAIYGDGSIFIDETLDPEENPAREGRYRFTLAHEGGGHWRLHQHLIVEHTAQASLFDGDRAPKFICRSSQAKERVEWQADFYASCLLMPRRLVHAEWRKCFGSGRPFVFSDYRNDPRWIAPRSTWTPFSEAARNAVSRAAGLDPAENHDFAFDRVAGTLAKTFNVSTQAMRIRLEGLGLLLREHPRQGSFSNVA